MCTHSTTVFLVYFVQYFFYCILYFIHAVHCCALDMSSYNISIPVGVGRLGWLGATQGPKFKIPLPTSFVPQLIGLPRTYARTDGQTFDWFYKSSRDRDD